VGRTLETTTSQTLLPARWVIVDDGSTDETPAILAEYSRRFGFIEIVTRLDRGARAVGPGVVESFYDGLRRVSLRDYDFVCKLDADLELPPRYFERAVERMRADPHLGNISGKLFERRRDGKLLEQRTGDENAVGPAKFYRVACFEEIGGFIRQIAWDGIDGHVCRMKGWIALSEDDPEMRIVHLRPMGSSQQNVWAGRLRWGRGKYFMGSTWYYVLAASVYRMRERPYISGGVGIALGYLLAALSRQERYSDREYRSFLKRYERSTLMLGRRRCLERYNERIRAAHARAG
jgi:biofilm PGA synthesis N-glycosyltransferase PgaC